MEQIATAKKKFRYWFWLTPLFLFIGLCGIWFMLAGGEEIIIFWPWPVLLALALLVPFGWMLEKRPKWVKWGLLLLLGLLGLVFWLFQTDLVNQFYPLLQSVLGGRPDPVDVTGAVAFLTAAVTWLLLACLWAKQTWLVWVLGTALLIAPPLLGFSTTWPTLFCLVIFLVGFAALVYGKRSSRRRKVVLRGTSQAVSVQKSSLSAVALALVVLLAGLLAVNWFGDSLYYLSGRIQYRVAQVQQIILPFASNSTMSNNGVISRSRPFFSGEEQIAAYTDLPPGETIYLKGFTGGEYQGGSWGEIEESQLFQTIEEDMTEGWNNRSAAVFRYLYYNLNQWTLRENAPQPRNLTLMGIYGRDNSWYPPYYYYWNTSYSIPDGYRFSYYQLSEIDVDWNAIDPSQEYLAENYRLIQDGYQEQALSVYTQVPEELVPQLTELCRDNPQEELEDIIAFIRTTLHTHLRYTTSPDTIPYNVDPVEYSLFEGHEGYCQHFASAAVLMFRLYGIPARYVSGYAVDPEDFEIQENGEYRASISDLNAHAWPEIFLEDYGWIPIEVTFDDFYNTLPTDEETQSQTSSTLSAVSSVSAQQNESELSTSSLLEGDASNSQENLGDSGLPLWFWWVFGGVLTVMVLILVLLLWRAMRLSRLKAGAKANTKKRKLKLPKALNKLLDRLKGLSAHLPYWMQRSSGGVRGEWSRMIRVLEFGGFWEETQQPAEEYFRSHPQANPFLTPEEMLRVLEIVGQAAYGKNPVDPAQAQFVQDAYLRTAKGVYQTLPWVRKIWFKWFWVAL